MFAHILSAIQDMRYISSPNRSGDDDEFILLSIDLATVLSVATTVIQHKSPMAIIPQKAHVMLCS